MEDFVSLFGVLMFFVNLYLIYAIISTHNSVKYIEHFLMNHYQDKYNKGDEIEEMLFNEEESIPELDAINKEIEEELLKENESSSTTSQKEPF